MLVFAELKSSFMFFVENDSSNESADGNVGK